MDSTPSDAGHPTGLAAYACRPEESRGRLHPEPESATRSCYQRDRDRIIHSGAFRKLKHKTQVFVYHEGDYYRTRLTHSIEVAQIARTVARQLGLNEDLTEALALAHDLGHTCFGHAGEDALDKAMAAYGGFDHNEQTIRIVSKLEQRYAEFDGLNLTWECLEGLAKHNGPLSGSMAKCDDGGETAVPPSIADLDRQMSLALEGYPSLEAQVASLCDDIAYNNHDVDDGLRAGLFRLDDLAELAPVGEAIAAVRASYPTLEEPRLIHETIRRLIGAMVEDLVGETRRRLSETDPGSAGAVRAAGQPIAAFSTAMAEQQRDLKAFLFRRMYRHYRVNRMITKAKWVVQRLFEQYVAQPDCLPDEWRQAAEPLAEADRARLVADYIAGMTDRYALKEYEKIFDIKAISE
jgi:dGTPase